MSLLHREGRVGDVGFPCVCEKAATSVSEMARSADNWTRDEDATGALSIERADFEVIVGGLDFLIGNFSVVESGRGSWSSQRWKE